jgi:hypothetical protein
MENSSKSKMEQFSEISFQFLQNDCLPIDELKEYIKGGNLSEKAVLYFKDDQGMFGHGKVDAEESRLDVAKDSDFSFFGFKSDNITINETVFYTETYGTNWFVISR